MVDVWEMWDDEDEIVSIGVLNIWVHSGVVID